ncbi:MAG: energy-dependent translational throttle protein EttA [Pseudomonadota bacterium]|nr:energy-dependent translational throttle protein EttA [Pseudomonadota bacterium]
MAQYVFQLQKVGKIVPPKKRILDDISLSFFPGAKIGVLGLNGAGKSTLLKIMAGIDKEIEGNAIPLKDLKIGYLPQEPQLDESLNVKGNLKKGLDEAFELLEKFNKISARFGDPMTDDEMESLLEEQGKLQNELDAQNVWDLDRKMEIASEALNLPKMDSPVTNLSGGEKRRVALCQLLISEPDMLLLDEPTNHLDTESVYWLERYLDDYKGTVVAITHDRYFLDNIAGWILELDRGSGFPWEGNYSSWLEQKEKRLAHEQKTEAAYKKNLSAELEWVKQNPKGRRSKNKARIQKIEEMQTKEFQKRNETNEIFIPPGPRLGKQVLSVDNLEKSIEGKKLFDSLCFEVPPGAIVGVIGPNGAGKTTLCEMLTGLVEPDNGKVEKGDTVKFGFVSQGREGLDDSKTVWEELSGGQDILKIEDFEINSRAYCGRFNFKGNDQQKFVKQLSGGERNRLHLAKTLLEGSNFMLLDEPTNDLDVETLRALEEAILNFPGCMFIVSHDRWFLDRVATHILAFEGNGIVKWFFGNYSEYHENFKKRAGSSQETKRFKPLTR